MDRKGKRKYDTVPDIYMSRNSNARFFRPHYPVEDSEYDIAAIPDEDISADNCDTQNDSFFSGDMQG